MTRSRLQFAVELTATRVPLPPEQRPAYEAAWRRIQEILTTEDDMTKHNHYQRLVELGRACYPSSFFPQVQHETLGGMARRVAWMEKALELKASDKELAYDVFYSAWVSGHLPSTVAEKAGIA